MEKISSILPTSSRVASVDMRDAAPVRPGTPSFGRPEGANAVRDREKERAAAAAGPIATTSQKGGEAHQAQMDWRTKEDRGAAIAKTMSDKFFVDRRKDAEAVEPGSGPGSAQGAAPIDLSRVAMMTANVESRPAGGREIDIDGVGRRTGPSAASLRDDLHGEPDMMPASPEGLYPKGSFIDYRA